MNQEELGPSKTKKNKPSEILESVLRPDNVKQKKVSSKHENKTPTQSETKLKKIDKDKTEVAQPKSSHESKNPAYAPLFQQLQLQTEDIEQPQTNENSHQAVKKHGNIQLERMDSQSPPISPSAINISRRNTSSDISLKIKNLQQLVQEKKKPASSTNSSATAFPFPKEGHLQQQTDFSTQPSDSIVKDPRTNTSQFSDTVAAKRSNKLQSVLSCMQLGRSTLSRPESLDKTIEESTNTINKSPIVRTNSVPSVMPQFEPGFNRQISDSNISAATKTQNKKSITTETQKNTTDKNKKEKSGNNKNRKLSIKEYQAKKNHGGSSSNDEGMMLEFTRLPSASSISKTQGPIRNEKSSDNAVIHVPTTRQQTTGEPSRKLSSSGKKCYTSQPKVPNEQLASGGDVVGNILGSIQPSQPGRQNSTSTANDRPTVSNQDMVCMVTMIYLIYSCSNSKPLLSALMMIFINS